MSARWILFSLLVALSAYHFYREKPFSEDMVRGKRILVTGSSMGIGEEIAYELARMGAHVMLTSRGEKRLQKVVQKCLDLGASSARYVAADMSNVIEAQRVIKETKDAMGGLDHLILNHVGRTFDFGPFQWDMEQVVKTMTVNFFSYVQLTLSALAMLRESQGSVVVVSSMAGRLPTPFCVPYAASKFALEGFYSSLRTELRLLEAELPVTVAVLGFIDTDTAVNNLKDKLSMSPSPKAECARAIVKGGMLREREVFYPYKSTRLILLFRDWFPELVDYFIGKSYLVENIIQKRHSE